jgi:hypothetical protein
MFESGVGLLAAGSIAIKGIVGGVLVSVVLSSGSARSQLEPPRRPKVDPGSAQSAEFASRSAQAEVAGDPRLALTLAEKGIQADGADPWPHYDRACALAALNRVEEAVASYRDAQQRFSAADRWGKSIAIYGRANVLAQAGRCDEAGASFAEYANFVLQADPKSADMARRHARECSANRHGQPDPGS